MQNLSTFCTCKDTKCPLHPTNHEKGCSLCVAKNLKLGEIPSCFFNAVDPDKKRKGYSVEDFAEVVMDNKKDIK